MKQKVTNIVIAGLGGQGVLKASDILADVAFRTGADVKKAEVHGMSQRGGFVTSDVRFGPEVLSPMVSSGEADFLVVLEPGELEACRHYLRPGGVLLTAECIRKEDLPTAKALNVGMLGALSAHLDIPAETWFEALKANLPEKLHEANVKAFAVGRAAGQQGGKAP
jgi:indolepyruvate ferredoxin oxidoreductase beta subunit